MDDDEKNDPDAKREEDAEDQFPQNYANTVNKIEAEDDLRKSFRSAGARASALERLRFTMKGKKLVVEAHGPKDALREIEDKVSEVKISGLSPTLEEELQPFVTTFGPENQSLHCQSNIMIQQVLPKRRNKVVSYEPDAMGGKSLNEPFPEIPRHPSMLSVLTFKRIEIEHFDHNGEKADEQFMRQDHEVLHWDTVPMIEEPNACIRWQKQGEPYRHHVVKAGFSVILAPRGYAEVKLGVSLLAPVGTYAVIAPVINGYQNSWELGDHKIDVDRNGEAFVRVVNRTDQRLIIPTGTTIGKIHVIRTRVNVNKLVTPKAYDKALLKMMFPKKSVKRITDTSVIWGE